MEALQSLKIKCNRILLVNFFDCHHELMGFFLHYCSTRNIECNIISPIDYTKWLEFYKLYFRFNVLPTYIPGAVEYDLIIVLTDNDFNFRPEWVTPNTVTLTHWYEHRHAYMKRSVPITQFYGRDYTKDYIFSTYEIPEITLAIKEYTFFTDEVHIAILGRAIPDDPDELAHITNSNATFHLINSGSYPHAWYKTDKRIKTYDGKITTTDLIRIIANCQYVYVTRKNAKHLRNFTSSASLGLAFTCLCRLIMPTEMNKALRMRTPLLYDEGERIELQVTVDYKSIYAEKLELMRDSSVTLEKLLSGSL